MNRRWLGAALVAAVLAAALAVGCAQAGVGDEDPDRPPIIVNSGSIIIWALGGTNLSSSWTPASGPGPWTLTYSRKAKPLNQFDLTLGLGRKKCTRNGNEIPDTYFQNIDEAIFTYTENSVTKTATLAVINAGANGYTKVTADAGAVAGSVLTVATTPISILTMRKNGQERGTCELDVMFGMVIEQR